MFIIVLPVFPQWQISLTAFWFGCHESNTTAAVFLSNSYNISNIYSLKRIGEYDMSSVNMQIDCLLMTLSEIRRMVRRKPKQLLNMAILNKA